MHRFLPKQRDNDKILQIIQRKVLKGTHLPIEVKEIQEGYLHRTYSKDIYQYLLQNTRNMCRQDNNAVSQKSIAGHQGVIKTYLTISDKFSYPI